MIVLEGWRSGANECVDARMQPTKLIQLFERDGLVFKMPVRYRDRANWVEERVLPPCVRTEEFQMCCFEVLRSLELPYDVFD